MEQKGKDTTQQENEAKAQVKEAKPKHNARQKVRKDKRD